MNNLAIAAFFLSAPLTVVTATPIHDPLDTRVSAVTLFPRGAEVVREGTLTLPAGDSSALISGLPNGLDPAQIRLSLANDAIKVGEVKLSSRQLSSSNDPEVNRLQRELVLIRDQIAEIDDGISAAQLKLKFLDSLSQTGEEARTSASAGTRLDVASLKATIDLLGSSANSAYQEIRTRKLSRRQLLETADRLERELKSARELRRAVSDVVVQLASPAAVETRLTLTYFQRDAGWVSDYEARLDSERGVLTLIQQARVYQRTSEDWDNVRLTLSTSRPSGELSAPRVTSEFLELEEPQPAQLSAAMTAPAMLEDVRVTAGRMNTREPAPDFDSRVDMSAGNFATSYRLPGASSVQNNSDDSTTIDIDEFEINPELVTRIVPRSSQNAFLTARFTYTGAAQLSAGALRIYVDGNYSGKARISALATNTEVILPMGIDPGVEVKSIDQGGNKGRTGLISKRKDVGTDYLFSITNRRATPTSVEVIDRVPVAVDRNIKVEVPATATEPTKQSVDDKRGVVVWKMTLDAEENWQILHQYTISHPAKKRLLRRVTRN